MLHQCKDPRYLALPGFTKTRPSHCAPCFVLSSSPPGIPWSDSSTPNVHDFFRVLLFSPFSSFIWARRQIQGFPARMSLALACCEDVGRSPLLSAATNRASLAIEHPRADKRLPPSTATETNTSASNNHPVSRHQRRPMAASPYSPARGSPPPAGEHNMRLHRRQLGAPGDMRRRVSLRARHGA